MKHYAYFIRTGLLTAVIMMSLAITATQVHAAVYYVDSVNGSDSYSGLSTSSPWRTLAKVSGSSIRPGDSVLLRCGRTWREQLTIRFSGTASSPITIGSYGTGDKPAICGADVFSSGWVSIGSNKWYHSSVSLDPDQVLFNEIRGKRKSSSGYLVNPRDWCYDAGTDRVYVYSGTNPANLTVEVGIRNNTVKFNGYDYIVVEDLQFEKTRHALVTFDNGSTYCTIRDCTFLQGPTDESSDSASVLYYTGSSRCEVSGSTFGKDTGADVSDQNWASYVGIYMRGTNQKAHHNHIYHSSTENENSNGFYAYGIRMTDVHGTCEVYENTIYHTGSHAVYSSGYSNQGDVFRIYNNTMSFTGQSGFNANRTIASDGVGGKGYVYGNEVSYANRLSGAWATNDKASCGIHFYYDVESRIGNDPYISWDCYNNKVHDCRALLKPHDEDSGGIGIDFNANGVKAYGNIVYNNWGKGAYIYNSDNCVVSYNIFYGNDCGITVSSNTLTTDTCANNKIYNNTFYRNYNGDDYGPGYDAEIICSLKSTNTQIRNNIIYADPNGYCIYSFDRGTNDVINNNLLYSTRSTINYSSDRGALNITQWRSLGYDTYSIVADPAFVNPTGHVFALKLISPAIDAAVNLGSTYAIGMNPYTARVESSPSISQNSYGSGWDMGSCIFILYPPVNVTASVQ